MNTNNKSLLGLCCFLSIIFAACEAKEPADSSPYPILDSGVWAGTSDATANIYWIDNNRVLFKTVKDNNKRLAYQGPFNLSIWEIGKGVTPYTPFAHRVDACLRDGIFRYTLEDEQKNKKVFYGKFGEEKPVTPPKMLYPYDLMNCRIADNPEIVAKRQNNRAIIPLLDRHGYLDRGVLRGEESLKETPTALYRPGQREAIKLPIRIGSVKYYAFKDAYYIEIGASAITGKPATTWWLYPDGRVEEVRLPTGPWGTGFSAHAIPLRIGFFMVSHAYMSGRDSGLAGGYFLQGEKFVKVINGSIRGPDVSPDGCKVAFSHVLYHDADIASSNDPTLRTLKLINFCTEEKNHGK